MSGACARARVRAALDAAGLQDAAHLARAVAPGEDLRGVWQELAGGADDGDDDDDYDDFARAYRLAVARADRHNRLEAHDSVDHVAEVAKRARLAEDARFQRACSAHGVALARDALPPPPTTLRTRARTSLAPVGGRAGRAVQGAAGQRDAERAKYVDELADVLLALSPPVVRQVAAGSDPRGALAYAAAGRRARTLRTRLRAWRAFARWLKAAYCLEFPTHWTQLLGYAEARAAEPCGRGTLQAFVWAVSFIERAGGYEEEDCHTRAPLFKNALRELVAGLSARAGGGERVQANRPLVAVLAQFERMVLDSDVETWYRIYSWWKLLQSWCALRADDHNGMSPGEVVVDRGGLTFVLRHSKTTGRDKKQEHRLVGLSGKAYFQYPDWGLVGWELLNAYAPAARDYLLPSPAEGLATSLRRPLRYEEAAGWSRALHSVVAHKLGMQAWTAILAGSHRAGRDRHAPERALGRRRRSARGEAAPGSRAGPARVRA